MPLIKFCGLTRQEDCDAARRLGADFCGFVFHPQSPRAVTAEQAAQLASGELARVGVFVTHDAAAIRRCAEIARLDFIQLHGDQPESVMENLGLPAIRVLWPERYASLAALEAAAANSRAALFLLDAGKSGGGGGKSLDFAALSGLRLPAPWLLAGGLSAANIPAALAQCSPAGLDVNSGAESAPGIKDAAKMTAAVEAAKKAGRCPAPRWGPEAPTPPIMTTGIKQE